MFVVQDALYQQLQLRGVPHRCSYFAGLVLGDNLAAEEAPQMELPPNPRSARPQGGRSRPQLRPLGQVRTRAAPRNSGSSQARTTRLAPSRPRRTQLATLTRGQKKRPQLRPRFPLSRARPAPRVRSFRTRTFNTLLNSFPGLTDCL